MMMTIEVLQTTSAPLLSQEQSQSRGGGVDKASADNGGSTMSVSNAQQNLGQKKRKRTEEISCDLLSCYKNDGNGTLYMHTDTTSSSNCDTNTKKGVCQMCKKQHKDLEDHDNDTCNACTEAYVGAVRKFRQCDHCHTEKGRLDYSPSQWYGYCTTGTIQCLSCQEEQKVRSIREDDLHHQQATLDQYRKNVANEQCRGYWEKDRHAVFALLQEKCAYDILSIPTAFYDCDATLNDPKNRHALEPFPSWDGDGNGSDDNANGDRGYERNIKDVLGTYDVIFVRYESEKQDDADYNFMQKRTTYGSLDLFFDANTDQHPASSGGDADPHTSQLRCLLTLDSPNWSNAGHEAPSGILFAFGDDGDILIDKVEGCNTGTEWMDVEDYSYFGSNTLFQFVRSPLSFDWIPSEDVPSQSHYAQQMRREAERATNQEGQDGGKSIPWLYHHTSIPESVTRLIREYVDVCVPETTFVLKEGDLWLSIEFFHESSSDTLNFAARRSR